MSESKCKACGGSGRVVILTNGYANKCFPCNGTGKEPKAEDVELTVETAQLYTAVFLENNVKIKQILDRYADEKVQAERERILARVEKLKQVESEHGKYYNLALIDVTKAIKEAL